MSLLMRSEGEIMEQEHNLSDYRVRLLNALKGGVRRSGRGASDPIQVFINDRRVGLLNGAGTKATLQVIRHSPIDSVHLRSEDGALLGGLFAPEYGFRSSRIPISGDAKLHWATEWRASWAMTWCAIWTKPAWIAPWRFL